MERYKEMDHQICKVSFRTISGKGQLRKPPTNSSKWDLFPEPHQTQFPKFYRKKILKHHTMMMYGGTEV
jgi:hypothetical protein